MPVLWGKTQSHQKLNSEAIFGGLWTRLFCEEILRPDLRLNWAKASYFGVPPNLRNLGPSAPGRGIHLLYVPSGLSTQASCRGVWSPHTILQAPEGLSPELKTHNSLCGRLFFLLLRFYTWNDDQVPSGVGSSSADRALKHLSYLDIEEPCQLTP